MDIHLKQASPTAANIHNRWWRERSERNLRFNSKIKNVPRRGRTSITAGGGSEANGTCGFSQQDKNTSSKRANTSKLCIYPICSPSSRTVPPSSWGTAGFAAFGCSTSGYGYSPSSRTLRLLNQRLRIFVAVGGACLR